MTACSPIDKELRDLEREDLTALRERGVLLEPMEFDVATWLAALGRYKGVPFMEEGREQPRMPEDDVAFDR